MVEFNAPKGNTPGEPGSKLKFPEISASTGKKESFHKRADYQSVAVYILNVSVSRLFLLSDRYKLPNENQVQQIKTRFSVFSELFALGAPPRLVVEGMAHPIFADDEKYTQSSGVAWANQCIEKFSKKGLIQPERVSGVPCGLPLSKDWSFDQINLLKSQLVSTILKKIPDEERRSTRYSPKDVESIVRGLDLSIEIITQDSQWKAPTQIWPMIQHIVEVGCLLLTVESDPDTVIAGLFHHVRDMISSPELLAHRLTQIRKEHGERVVAIIESSHEIINPALEPVAKMAGAPIFGPPLSLLNRDRFPRWLQAEVGVINAASVLSHLFHRMNQVEMPFGVEVITEEEASHELWEFGGFYDFFLSEDVPNAFLLLYQDRLGIFINKIREVSVRTAELSVSHRVFRRLQEEFDFSQLETSQALERLIRFSDVANSLSASNIPRRFLEEGMLHPEHGLCDDEVRAQIMQMAHTISGKLRQSFKVLFSSFCNIDDFSNEEIGTDSHQVRLSTSPSKLPWHDFKRRLEDSIIGRVPKDELRPPMLRGDELSLISRAVALAKDFVVEAEAERLPRSRVETFMHLTEVAFLLTRSRVPADVVVAGVLHDVYEFFSGSRLAEIRRQVRTEFGDQVDTLIGAVTEPGRDREGATEGYYDKKSTVIRGLDALAAEDPLLASHASAILCASKVCTLGEGLAHFKEFGTTRGWSKGSYTSNFMGMCALHDLFLRLKTPTRLLQLYQMILEDWVTAGSEWTLLRA